MLHNHKFLANLFSIPNDKLVRNISAQIVKIAKEYVDYVKNKVIYL